MDEERYDIVIVGGRVAGSTLAALLGHRGVDVLLYSGLAVAIIFVSLTIQRGPPHQ